MFWIFLICVIFVLLIIPSVENRSISIRNFRTDISTECNNFASIIQNAIDNDRKIKIVYQSSNLHSLGEITSRIIKPIEIKYGKNISNNELIKNSEYGRNNLYLRAYCELRNEERHFRLDRIKFVKVV